jgi:hypothetical protein
MLRCWTLTFGALCLVLVACAPASALRKTVPYLIRSEPPGALIHIDGEAAGTTPATITFFVSRWWVGLWYSPDGWRYGDEAYTVTALPPLETAEGLKAETQVVRPSQHPQGSELFFDLRPPPLEPPRS